MSELAGSTLHEFLKKVGEAFLLNQGCFLTSEEVPVGRWGQAHLGDLDERRVIDVCGVSDRFSPCEDGLTDGHGFDQLRHFECKRNILRGIEVKVSRSDFRNGFIWSACNYNYLLTPMRLLAPSEIPRGVSLMEFNKHKFKCELQPDGVFCLEGLRLTRRPVFREIPQHQIDNATAWIARRALTQQINALSRELSAGSDLAVVTEAGEPRGSIRGGEGDGMVLTPLQVSSR